MIGSSALRERLVAWLLVLERHQRRVKKSVVGLRHKYKRWRKSTRQYKEAPPYPALHMHEGNFPSHALIMSMRVMLLHALMSMMVLLLLAPIGMRSMLRVPSRLTLMRTHFKIQNVLLWNNYKRRWGNTREHHCPSTCCCTIHVNSIVHRYVAAQYTWAAVPSICCCTISIRHTSFEEISSNNIPNIKVGTFLITQMSFLTSCSILLLQTKVNLHDIQAL